MSLSLSAAMRLGAPLKPQGRGRLLYQGSSCAIGAALDAVGKLGVRDEIPTYGHLELARDLRYAAAVDHWPILNRVVESPAACAKGYRTRLELIVISLNDHYGWTRHDIADFIELVEHIEEAESLPMESVA